MFVFRVGRTGRAGDKEGVAITLLVDGSNKDAHFAGQLVNSLTLGEQEVPRTLYELAMKVGAQSLQLNHPQGLTAKRMILMPCVSDLPGVVPEINIMRVLMLDSPPTNLPPSAPT